ncbi:MAG: DUF72 domain-containing protein [Nannocystaceae bacterium]|nr:DUF72 domain-containing protein [bacterium]
MQVYVGTSGYQYDFWRGGIYPEGLDKSAMLAAYAEHFRTVEVNNTFYRMPKREVVQRWSDATPDDFRFVIKASKRITHKDPLTDADSLAYLFKVLEPLEGKLGAVLFQLPPYLRKGVTRLKGFLDLLPDGAPAVLEFRHVSWFCDEVYDVLRGGPAAMSLGDFEGKASDTLEGGRTPTVHTAPWGYARLREDGYDAAGLQAWAERLREPWERLFVFFKHEETAPQNAKAFAALCGES